MQKIFSIHQLETSIILPPDDAGHFMLPVSLPLFLHMSPHLEWCASKFWNELEAKGRFQILLNIFGLKGDCPSTLRANFCWKTSHELGGFPPPPLLWTWSQVTTNFPKKRVLVSSGYQPSPSLRHSGPIPYLCLPDHAGGLGVLGQLGHRGNVVVEPGLIHCWFGLSLCCCPGIKPWSDH